MSDSGPNAPIVQQQSNLRKLPDFKQSVKLKYVKLGYHNLITHGMFLFMSPLFVVIAAQLSTFYVKDIHDLWEHLQYNLISVILCSTLLVFLATLYFLTRPRPVYLVNFSCYKPEDARKCMRQIFMERSSLTGTFTDENHCELTRTPYGRRFISQEINSYLVFLFEMIASRGPIVGLDVSLSRYDLFHGHIFIAKESGRLGILFHVKEYPAYEKEVFPYNMGYCRRGNPSRNSA